MADTPKTKKPTLADEDIPSGAKIARRSFLAGAVGSATALGACVAVPVPVNGGGVVVGGGYTDSDNGSTTDPVGRGRGPGGYYPAITDADVGGQTDRSGYGRGGT